MSQYATPGQPYPNRKLAGSGSYAVASLLCFLPNFIPWEDWVPTPGGPVDKALGYEGDDED